MPDRSGQRKTREQLSKRRVPELGYYFIVTDTKETEQNYMIGLRDGSDPYYYCFKDEGCHIIYHRFLPEDYADFGF